MSTSVKRIFRLDRIVLVILILIGCSSGVVALVSADETSSQQKRFLSHPEPLVKVVGYTLPDKELVVANSTDGSEEIMNEVLEVVEEKEFKIGSLQPCSCCKKTIRVPKNPYTRHQAAARSLPNSFYIKNDVELNYGLSINKLVEVEDGRGYRISRLKHSSALLLPDVRDLLEDMGHDYADALVGTDSEGTVFRVTSMTRTEVQQKSLRRRNRNATVSKSTHSYGASFDIAFMDRASEDGNCNLPTREIQKLLLRYQKEGRILIIPEGGCMHITLLRVKS
jgi:hypothetical protein|tara:strand:+ start:2695 stop:3534 length:840 start_codon:yes stop_codon:yes gene_type:complete